MLQPQAEQVVGLLADRGPRRLAADAGCPVVVAGEAGRLGARQRVVGDDALEQRSHGALLVARRQGRPVFEEFDLELSESFAVQAAVALEPAEARHNQDRLALLQERERIARDLHDHVIQRLFACGLSLEVVETSVDEDAVMAGASGYLLKEIRGAALTDAVRQVAAGGRCSTLPSPASSSTGCGSPPRRSRR